MDISIDLETLAKTPDAFICSIGATAFNINNGDFIDDFYLKVSLQYPQTSRKIDPDTVRWWMTQSESARGELTSPINLLSLSEVLGQFYAWVCKFPNCRVWGNGATFDISILENAFGYKPPWKYYHVMDMRTILAHAKCKGYKNPSFAGVKHNALSDSQNQAKIISECWIL